MKLHFTTIVVLLLLVLFLSSSPAFPQAKENEGKHLDSTEIRAFLEKEGFGSLPDGMVVRVSACLSGEAIDSSADSSSVELRETWEFSSNQVRRIEFGNYQDADGKNTHERVESRTFQTKGLCQALLDGKAIEIGARKGKGPEIGFVGSKYDRGIRSIEVDWRGKTILHLFECDGPTLHLYAESDAQAFGALFSLLVEKAKVAFVPKAPQTDDIAWGDTVDALQLGVYLDVEGNRRNESLIEDGTLRVNIQIRNTGKTPVRVLPSIYGCAAIGSCGAIPVSKLTLRPVDAGEPLSINYCGFNHLSEDRRLGKEDQEYFSIEIAPGKSLEYPYLVSCQLDDLEESRSRWRRSGSTPIAEGKYMLNASLTIHRAESSWKGELTSGPLELQIQLPKQK